MTTELHTARLRLRGWTDADRAPYAALNADADVMHYFPSALTEEQSDAMVDRMSERLESSGWGLWAAERLDTHEFIGFIGLSSPGWHIDGLTPCVEIGWRLAKEHWGQGFAPEGAGAALAHAFQHVDLPSDEVVSFTTVTNHKSRRVMEKIGLRMDARREFDHPMTPGWWGVRHVVYCIDRPTWKAGVAR
jgi:ribosomal-protein-alanine N-acetyltransferase